MSHRKVGLSYWNFINIVFILYAILKSSYLETNIFMLYNSSLGIHGWIYILGATHRYGVMKGKY